MVDQVRNNPTVTPPARSTTTAQPTTTQQTPAAQPTEVRAGRATQDQSHVKHKHKPKHPTANPAISNTQSQNQQLADSMPLGKGMKNDPGKVKALQEQLMKTTNPATGKPYLAPTQKNGKPSNDGQFGGDTEAAVKAFQQQNNISPANGRADVKTRDAVTTAANPTSTTPTNTTEQSSPTPTVNNSEAQNQIPRNADGSVDNKKLDAMTPDQRKAILKGLEAGTYTSASEDADKGAIMNSLMRTNPEAIDADTAKAANRGLHDMGDPAKMGTNPATGKPYTQKEADALMDNFAKKNPDGMKAAMAADSTTWSNDHEADQAAYGRMGAAMIRAEMSKPGGGDPAKVLNDLSQIGGTFDGQANATQIAKNLSDEALTKLQGTPKGQDFLRQLYKNMDNAVLWNGAAQTEQRARLFPHLNVR